jgi:hypothetical protein
MGNRVFNYFRINIMSKKYKTKFAQQWLDPTTHSTWTWLHEVTADSYKAGCKLCKSTFDVGNMGISSIISLEPIITCFFSLSFTDGLKAVVMSWNSSWKSTGNSFS